MQESHPPLVESLLSPACYDHPVDRVKLIETHISWVFLAGEFAYKMKKPVNFGFLDFSSLDRRQHYCEEELRLNRRFAPQLYLGVTSIGGSAEKPILGGTPAIDYLIRMKRFSRQNELDWMLEQGRLTAEQIERFADYLARLHQHAPRVDRRSFLGSPDSIMAPVEENFDQLRQLLPDARHLKQLAELEDWNRSSFEKLRGLMVQRKAQGFIRECHGDLHLANMIWLEDQPIMFDCIEFNENLRCIDLVNDYAFLLMDLDDRHASLLGWDFLNRYLQQTGDFQALPLLNFYKCYRALVRGKITGLRLHQPGLGASEVKLETDLLQSYLDLATGYSHPRQSPLIITHGFSASGKSTFVNQLAPLYGAVSVHSDIERKRLYGLDSTDHSNSTVAAGLYTKHASQQTYNRLQEAAEITLSSGFPVIVDATFLNQRHRIQMQQLATRRKVPFIILDFTLPEKELFRRVAQRSQNKDRISEATAAVLRHQLENAEPLSSPERQSTLGIDSESSPATIAELIEKQQQAGPGEL